jgi:hypothetical protein
MGECPARFIPCALPWTFPIIGETMTLPPEPSYESMRLKLAFVLTLRKSTPTSGIANNDAGIDRVVLYPIISFRIVL